MQSMQTKPNLPNLPNHTYQTIPTKEWFNKGCREVLGGKDDIGNPYQANLEALAFILWCQKSLSE